jgi:MFS family permease
MISAHTEVSARGRSSAPVVVTAAFASMLLSANIAATLYAGFARQYHFSTALLALIFAVYALVLVPSLLLFGQISDRVGRRAVIVSGLALALVGLVLFATAHGIAFLFAARAVQGLAQGMMSGAATAQLAELVGADDPRRAALFATLAQSAGSALGVLLGGVLAQWSPAPGTLPFVAGMVVVGIVAALVFTVPETAPERSDGFAIRRPRVPAEIRGAFARISLTAAAIWSVGALFLSVLPSYAGKLVLHSTNLALLGLIGAIVLGVSALAQWVVRRGAPPAKAQAGGLLLLALGLVALVASAPLTSAALLVLAAVLAGAGHGFAVLAAQDDLTRIAPDEQRGEVSAAFYVCIYLGVALPVIGVGVLAQLTTLYIGVTTFAVVTGVAALTVAKWHLAQGR